MGSISSVVPNGGSSESQHQRSTSAPSGLPVLNPETTAHLIRNRSIWMLPYGRTWTPPSDASDFRSDRFGIGRTWLFAGSERGGEQAVSMYTLIGHRQAERRRPAVLARRRPPPGALAGRRGHATVTASLRRSSPPPQDPFARAGFRAFLGRARTKAMRAEQEGCRPRQYRRSSRMIHRLARRHRTE